MSGRSSRMQLLAEEPVELAGPSACMQRLRAQIARVAAAPRATVLLEGPTGAGKSLAARAVHSASARAAGPFVVLPCTGWSTGALERELFGTPEEPGSGRMAQAQGGTLLLDEVAELPLELQGVLLRVLEQRTWRPAGTEEERPSDVRVLASTRLDLQQLAGEGRFRDDLYYRLNVHSLRIPALQERVEDVECLARLFAAASAPGEPPELSSGALARLRSHPWQGNVRELKSVIERAVLQAGAGPVRPEHLGLERPQASASHPDAAAALPQGLCTLREVEEAWIRQVLAACDGNRTRSALELGIHRATLHAKLRLYGIA